MGLTGTRAQDKHRRSSVKLPQEVQACWPDKDKAGIRSFLPRRYSRRGGTHSSDQLAFSSPKRCLIRYCTNCLLYFAKHASYTIIDSAAITRPVARDGNGRGSSLSLSLL